METNYKSDFDFLLRLYDCRGLELGWPDYDWECRFWTTQKANAFVASCRGGECRNCFNDGGVIHVVCDNHRLGAGVLEAEFTALLPDAMYGDGNERVVVPARTKIELVRGAACPEAFDVELTLPLLKGDTGSQGPQGERGAAFTYEDFTEAQIEELQRPAAEAVARADEAAKNAQDVADMYAGELDRKADRSELSNVYAEEPLTAGSFPGINTYSREELKKDLFIDLWNNAAGASGCYNAETGLFELNGLTDISYAEAQTIYKLGTNCEGYMNLKYRFRSNLWATMPATACRTFMPMRYCQSDWNSAFYGCSKLEALNIIGECTVGYHCFWECSSLKEIKGEIWALSLSSTTDMFYHCYALEPVS